MAKRVNVYFSDDIYVELQKMAKERGKTLSDVLRDAVALEKYAADTKREGGRVLLQSRNGETRELLPR